MGHNFKHLEIWKQSMDLTKEVYSLVKTLPKEEQFGLINQIQRCSVSIPSNIAEGSGRNNDKEFRHFLALSLSSSYELETQLILASDLYSLGIDSSMEKLNQIQKMIIVFKRKFD